VHAPTSTNAALKEVLEELCAPSDATVVSQEEAALAGLEQFTGCTAMMTI
jgi:hypothetical protein